MQKFSLVCLLTLLIFSSLYAQQTKNAQNYAQIKGRIVENNSAGDPVGFATVHLLPQGVFATTDAKGFYELKNVDPGKTSISIQFIGMEQIDTTLNLTPGRVYTLNFKMRETSFKLDEITVTSVVSKAGSATASNISRQAMDHLQASSIKDIMQLLPGASIVNSNLSVSNNINIRTIATTSDSRSSITASNDASTNMNSLGTAIIMDGAALSNNANMQVLNATISGANSVVGGGSSPAGGYDLRGISTDNVESVEVIRGIPSVQYGDMTSGAVIIKTKAGREPLNVKVQLNPYTYAASVSKGIQLGEKAGALNLSGDYAYDTRSLTTSNQYYQRFALRGLYTNSFGENFNMNTSLDLNYRKDTRKTNPDDIRTKTAYGAKEYGLRFNSNGTLRTPNAGWLKNINYVVAFSYADKHSYYEQLLGNAFAAYSMSMTDGGILSNRPGQKVFDNEGKEITHITSSEQNYYATYLPYEYFSHYDVYGKELNLQASVKANFNKRWGRSNNNMIYGVDYKMDGNLGKGTEYDLATPPQRAGGDKGYRPRAFKDIPFINQISIYGEDMFTHSFGKHDLKLTAGVRFDIINSKQAITPRFNASFEIIPSQLWIRGGYGVLAKAPTALYLYPQNAYFDYVNFNNLGDESVAKDEQLLVGTTRVFETKNKDFKIAKNTKAEVGFDWKFNNDKMGLYVTGYYEKLRNGYKMGYDLDCFKIVPYKQYSIYEKNPGAIPILQLLSTSNVFAMYMKPLNTVSSTNKGVEYELNLGRINSIRTAINISGAWMQTKDRDNGYSYSTNANGNNLERNIGVYEQGVETHSQEIFNTTFRITHNIPKIGFVVTLTAQVNWNTKEWYEYGNDTMFEKYISYIDGKVYDFDPAKKDDPEFAYLFDKPADNRFIIESTKPYTIFNLTVSKELGNFLTASFFVNNLFNNRPLYEKKKSPGSYTELGIPTFFGFDLKINIK